MSAVSKSDPISIMFVCLGNICRSPLAEGVFTEKVKEAGLQEYFDIESSGTGDWHVGDPPDKRMCQTAQRKGLEIDHLRSQQFKQEDLDAFDHIFVMDKSNLHDVLFLDEEDQYSGKVRLFREFDPQPENYQVPDPYHGGREGFENVYSIVDRTAEAILQRLVEEYDLETAKA